MKTPKEKAQELFNKMRGQCWYRKENINRYGVASMVTLYKEDEAKKSALIAIDEMISQLAIINNNEGFNISKYGNYWQEVKSELKKMKTE